MPAAAVVLPNRPPSMPRFFCLAGAVTVVMLLESTSGAGSIPAAGIRAIELGFCLWASSTRFFKDAIRSGRAMALSGSVGTSGGIFARIVAE